MTHIIINKDQVWEHKEMHTKIIIIKWLGNSKWEVKGKLGNFKIRTPLIHENYELAQENNNDVKNKP